MEPLFFATPAGFRQWLEENHESATELLVGYYKVGSGNPSMSWAQSVDEALCFGWIDGVRKSLDTDRFYIRFTPRQKTSIWSAVNIKKVEELTEKGLMRPAGLASFTYRMERKSKVYAYENEAVAFSTALENQFQAHSAAWAYFQQLAPSYRKLSTNWVMSAKQEATQQKRLQALITDSQAGTNRWKDNKYAKKG